jgi:hypothetical protein
MLESLHLRNVGPSPEMGMDMAPRLNLITGDNGLGKSFLLDVAWYALTRRWPHDVNPALTSGYAARPTDVKRPATIRFALQTKAGTPVEYESKYVPRDEAWLGRAGRPWNPGLVVYAHADGGFSVWDPARNYWKTRKGVDVQERLPAYVFSAKDVWDGLVMQVEGRPTVVCNGLIRDWSSWIRERGRTAEQMEEVLHTLSPAGDALSVGPLTRLSLEDARDIPSIRTAYSPSVPIVYASSGVRRIVGMAYMLIWSWNEHVIAAERIGERSTPQVVMLVDEIESHLHPRWQRSILKSLLQVATTLHAQARVQLITATHSPLILAAAEPAFKPDQDAWFDLDLEHSGDDAQVVLQRRQFVPLGDVSNWLTSEAFDLAEPRSAESERAFAMAKNLLRRNTLPTPEEVRAVEQALVAAGVPDIDPFWVRWSQFLRKAGLQE